MLLDSHYERERQFDCIIVVPTILFCHFFGSLALPWRADRTLLWVSGHHVGMPFGLCALVFLVSNRGLSVKSNFLSVSVADGAINRARLVS
jgi:hypothetical protein